MKVSNCCGVSGNQQYKTTCFDADEVGLCPKCGEHCEYVEEEETKKQTAVEFVFSKLPVLAHIDSDFYSDLMATAKEMERKQIEDSYESGAVTIIDNRDFGNLIISKQDYYNKTYKA